MLSAAVHSSSQCQGPLRRAKFVACGWHHGQKSHAEGLSTNLPMGLVAGDQMREVQMAVQPCRLHPATCLHPHLRVTANSSALQSSCVHKMLYSQLQQLQVQPDKQVSEATALVKLSVSLKSKQPKVRNLDRSDHLLLRPLIYAKRGSYGECFEAVPESK